MTFSKLLLCTAAALSFAHGTAQADDLAALKAQIEGLNLRLAQVEATPAVPAGYQLLTVSDSNRVTHPDTPHAKFYGATGTQIGIVPTADVPASATFVWTGFVSAAASYQKIKSPGLDANVDGDFIDVGDVLPSTAKAFDIFSKAGLNVTGTTDTAVGEVGVSIDLLAEVATVGGTNRDHDSSLATDGFYGWWKITPELELAGGVYNSLAHNNQGWDGSCSCYYAGFDGAGVYGTSLGDNKPAQMRLTYATGPFSFAMAIEDYDNDNNISRLGYAGEVKVTMDSFAFELNGGYWDTAVAGDDSNWTINAGGHVKLGDMATLSIAAGTGEDGHSVGKADRYNRGSAFVNFSLSDAIAVELGVSRLDYKGASDDDATSFGGGLYFSPVAQLTFGLEADITNTRGADDTQEAALLTIYRF
jgi:hypothetical protein